MTIFMSKMKRPVVVVKPLKINSDGDTTQEPLRVYFENNFFQTEDENVIQFLRKLPNFGADYWEVDSKIPVENNGPKFGVTQMDTQDKIKENEIANIKKDVEDIKKGFGELKDLILQVASKRAEEPTSDPETKNEETPVEEPKRRGRPAKE